MARNGIPKLIFRIFVDPQNDIPAKKSRLIKHCKSFLSSAKWETTKGNQLEVYRARFLFSDLLETSIDYSPTSCLLPLCKTIEKMEKGNNKKSNDLFPSFLPFCPFSRTSAFRLMFYWWNFQLCYVEADMIFSSMHKLSQSAKIRLINSLGHTKNSLVK